jgi:hypothetical protein
MELVIVILMIFQKEFYNEYFLFVFMNLYQVSVPIVCIKAIQGHTDQVRFGMIYFWWDFLEWVAGVEHKA